MYAQSAKVLTMLSLVCFESWPNGLSVMNEHVADCVCQVIKRIVLFQDFFCTICILISVPTLEVTLVDFWYKVSNISVIKMHEKQRSLCGTLFTDNDF